MSLDPQVRPLPASSRARGARRTLRQAALGAALLAAVAGAPPARAQQPFIGEIRLVPFNFAPVGWAFCDGQLMAISENTALFALIGTTYGGDGISTFALPDLRGRVATEAGQGPGLSPHVLGEMFGSETVTLTPAQLPVHTHAALADSGMGSTDRPNGRLYARDAANVPHYGPNATVQLLPAAVGMTGGGQPHENRPPYLVQHYIIALFGIFPAQSKPEVGGQGTPQASPPGVAPGQAAKGASK
ncbi:MAG TPA: tail fiber protein [Candidatus Saccharimonadales bacterium]|nr:tail fiber protein [Candidatus Saccharimonadales bacterium]